MPDSTRTRTCTRVDVDRALEALEHAPRRLPASTWPVAIAGLDEPGLYSWWVDDRGAAELEAGLECGLTAGRIYAGQTGATKWPSGRVGTTTLRDRLGSNHLHGSIRGSTFRRTLAACLLRPIRLRLAVPNKLSKESENALSAWMRSHLELAIFPFRDRDALGDLEDRVLTVLDPPLNLEGMAADARRQRLSELRRRLGRVDGTLPELSPTTHDVKGTAVATFDGRPKLHEEIVSILREAGRPMRTDQIAEAVNRRGLYVKQDGTPVTPFQVHGRTKNYSHLFDRDGRIVRLKSS